MQDDAKICLVTTPGGAPLTIGCVSEKMFSVKATWKYNPKHPCREFKGLPKKIRRRRIRQLKRLARKMSRELTEEMDNMVVNDLLKIADAMKNGVGFPSVDWKGAQNDAGLPDHQRAQGQTGEGLGPVRQGPDPAEG